MSNGDATSICPSTGVETWTWTFRTWYVLHLSNTQSIPKYEKLLLRRLINTLCETLRLVEHISQGNRERVTTPAYNIPGSQVQIPKTRTAVPTHFFLLLFSTVPPRKYRVSTVELGYNAMKGTEILCHYERVLL